jgi:four helix bundle protein
LIVDSRESGVGSRKSGVESRKSEVGSRKSEVESRKSGVGSRESEVGSRESEVGSRKSGVGSRERRHRVGIKCALRGDVKARKLEDVLVYQKALTAADEVSAFLERPAIRKVFDLHDQLTRSSNRVGPLISEGYGQLTDRHKATYLGRARGSALETKTHLRRAFRRGFITQDELSRTDELYDEIARMLKDWTDYLLECDWRR